MKTIQLSRRTFTLGLGSSLLLYSQAYGISAANHTITGTESTLNKSSNKLAQGFASAGTDHNNQHWLAILNHQGELTHKLALPSRAHQITVHPTLPVVAVAARRPGTFLMIVDANSGQLLQEIHPVKGHHFYGHSVYSFDGKKLFTTENHIESGEGRVFVRDATANYQVLSSFPSQGIGPHEIKMHPDGITLLVANGGILTHPESGRAKLNLETMSPSLVYLSAENGALLEEVRLPEHLHKLSIRHIDINAAGQTAIAMQYQGDKSDHMPLVALHQKGQKIQTLWAPEYVNRRMKNYCGSVCFNQSGSIFAVSSPRGDIITLWDTLDGEYITQLRCPDVCGISPTGKHGFTFSNGLGKLYAFDMKSALLKEVEQQKGHELSWDNHLSLLT